MIARQYTDGLRNITKKPRSLLNWVFPKINDDQWTALWNTEFNLPIHNHYNNYTLFSERTQRALIDCGVISLLGIPLSVKNNGYNDLKFLQCQLNGMLNDCGFENIDVSFNNEIDEILSKNYCNCENALLY